MLKLVSQFDSEKARVSVSTPTCASMSCCCCCCCIVSAIASAKITKRSFAQAAKVNQEARKMGSESSQEGPAKAGGEGAARQKPASVGEFFVLVLPLEIIIFGSLVSYDGVLALLGSLAVYVFAVHFWCKSNNAGPGTQAFLLFVYPILFTIEFFGWFMLFTSGIR